MKPNNIQNLYISLLFGAIIIISFDLGYFVHKYLVPNVKPVIYEILVPLCVAGSMVEVIKRYRRTHKINNNVFKIGNIFLSILCFILIAFNIYFYVK